MQQKIVWILVVDAGNARIIERIGTIGGLLEIHNLTPSHESIQEQGLHEKDLHEQQMDHFAKEIVVLLNEAHLNKNFDELYVLASAEMLGHIRHHIINTNHHIGPKVAKELTGDLVNFSLDDLEKYLAISSG